MSEQLCWKRTFSKCNTVLPTLVSALQACMSSCASQYEPDRCLGQKQRAHSRGQDGFDQSSADDHDIMIWLEFIARLPHDRRPSTAHGA